MTSTQLEDVAHLEQLVSTLTHRLHIIERQIAEYGLAVPPHIVLDKEQTRRELAQASGSLRRARGNTLGEHAPYLGLATFQEQDAALFFGREALVAELVEHIRDAPFLAVLGPSGSGKSSLVRAGLIPALKQGVAPNSERWCYITIKPGARPLDILAAALTTALGKDLTSALVLSRALAENDRALLVAADLLLDGKDGARLVLVVDQAEELWTLTPTDPDMGEAFLQQQQRPFIRLLLAAVAAPASPLLVVLTMRADFLHRAAEHNELARWIAAHDVIVSPMTPDELRGVIERPAEIGGGIFEPGLVDDLIEHTVGRPGALPLLEYTLLELWKARELDGTVTWTSFRSLGGVEGTLAARADAILTERYATEAQRGELRAILLRLVQPGEGAADTRRRVPLQNLIPVDGSAEAVYALLKPLSDERLITTGHDEASGAATVEVAHEALIRAWPTFGRWINESREDLRLQLQLEEAVKEWISSDKNEDFLWHGLRLANILEWVARAQPRLTVIDQRFLTTSRAVERKHMDAEMIRKREIGQLMASRSIRSRLRRYSVWMLITLVITGSLFLNLRETKGKLTRMQALGHAVAALSERNRSPQQAQLLAIASLPAVEEYSSAVTQALYSTADNTPMHNILNKDNSSIAVALKWRSSRTDRPLAWSSDGQQVLTGDPDGVVRLWDATSGLQLGSFTEHTAGITAVAWIYRNKDSTDTNYVLAGSEDGAARIWDATTGILVRSLDAQAGAVTAVAWSPNNDWSVAVGYEDGSIRIWLTKDIWPGDTKEPDLAPNLCRAPGAASPITALAWNSIGEQKILAGDNSTARIWAANCRPLLTFSKPIGPITALAWSANEQQVLIGSSAGNIGVWNMLGDTPQEQSRILTKYSGAVSSVAYLHTRYGEQMFAGSSDGTANIWDAITGTKIRDMQGYSNSIWAVTPDGSWIVNTGINEVPNIWPTDMSYIIADLTHNVCALPDDQIILIENPTWQGCVTELAATAEYLKMYDALRGRTGSL